MTAPNTIGEPSSSTRERPALHIALVLCALSALGIAQPLLDIYGRNAAALSAAQLSRRESLLFLVGVALVPAALATATTLIVRARFARAGHGLFLAWVGCFAGLFVAVLMRNLGAGNGPSLLAVPAGAVAVVGLIERVPVFESFLRVLAALLPASVVLFLLAPAGDVLLTPDADAVAVEVESGPPLLLIVFDELSVNPLVGTDGAINGDRFPGFARLAKDSTWFRDTTTVNVRSELAVPAILTGRVPALEQQPFSWDHPDNVFTLLGGSREVDGFESFTSLCPSSVCPEARQGGGGISSFLSDALVVYGHLALPPAGRDRLPRIDRSWSGFTATGSSDVDFDKIGAIEELYASGGPFGQTARLTELIDRIVERGPQSSAASVYHGLVPHRPYQMTVDGRFYDWRDLEGNTEIGTRQRYQAMMMQTIALDAVLLDAIERLDAAGIWDDMVVAVVADHGIAFEPGSGPRQELRTIAPDDSDLLRVPLFIKVPGTAGGEINDCPASTIDVLPTLMAVLAPDAGTSFDGVDLFATCPDPSRRVVGSEGEPQFAPASGLAPVLDRVVAHDRWFPADGDAGDILATGASADLIGLPVAAESAPSPVLAWSIDDLDALDGVDGSRPGSIAPAQFVGRIDVAEALPVGTEAIVVIDGVAAGVVHQLDGVGPGVHDYTAMVDVDLLRDGRPTLDLVVRLPDGRLISSGTPHPSLD